MTKSPPRKNTLKRALLAVTLVVAIVGALSWRRVLPEARAFRIGPGGKVTRLAPGLRFAPPIVTSIVLVPPDPLRARGEAAIRTREGAELKAPYEIEASMPDAAILAWLARSAGGRDPAAAMHQAATEALETWARTVSGDGVLLGEGRAAAEGEIGRRLAALGFEAVQVRLAAAAGPPEAQAAAARQALRGRLVPTGLKVAILGLDAADWEIIDPLVERGLLPNIARLRRRAAWGPMKSMDPMLSPLLWTTVATGKPPEEHGIIDFLVRDPRTGKPVPFSSRARRVDALWNILTAAGKSSDVIAWWATWPAEEIQGTLVSDRVAYSTFSFTSDLKDATGATWPPDYYQDLRPLLVRPESIRDDDLRRFADATPDEFRRLAQIVASARSYQAAALDLLKRGQPDLFALYYQGIDEVCHRFAHFMAPKMAMVSDADYRRYKGTVEAYYVYQDALLGEVIDRLSSDTVVFVLSDHGFRNGTGRPPNDPPYIEGKPGLWHRRYGILMVAGPAIRPGRLDTHGLLEIAPTVLYLLGLPTADDMPGAILKEAIDPAFLARVPARTVASYEGLGRAAPQDIASDDKVDDEMVEKLRSLGYVGSEAPRAPGASAGGRPPRAPASPGGPAPGEAAPGGGQALVTASINEATLYLKNKDYARAEASVDAALRAAPDLVPGLILKAQIAREQKRYDESIATAKRILALDPEGERQSYTQIAQVFAEAGRIEDGVGYLSGLARAHPQVGEARAALGALLLKGGDKAAAEAELLAALRIDPSMAEPLTDLHALYQGTDKVLGLEDIVRAGLKINDQSVVHHNWMGLIYEWKGDLPHAEAEFRRAMDLDPDYAATMANMGALYGRSGRLSEAVAILTRAVSKDRDNIEAWVNLGAAEGRLRHPKQAITALETARGKGAKSTTLFNALALAYLQDHQPARAADYLKQSLALDPNQKDARDLLAAVTPRS